jgi:hypothetical protein
VVPRIVLPDTAKHVVVLGQLTPCRSLVVPDGPLICHAVAPPSVVLMIKPPDPTAKHVVALGQLTPFIGFVDGDVSAFQVVPLVVPTTPPGNELLNVATHTVVLAQLTALNRSVVAVGVSFTQLVPPFVVLRIVVGPTAKHVVVLGQLMPLMEPLSVATELQVVPFVVASMTWLPPAKQTVALGQLME